MFYNHPSSNHSAPQKARSFEGILRMTVVWEWKKNQQFPVILRVPLKNLYTNYLLSLIYKQSLHVLQPSIIQSLSPQQPRSFGSTLKMTFYYLLYSGMKGYTYIVTNPKKTTLYTGVTNNLQERIVKHYLNRGDPETFAGKYYCYCLVWYETFPTMHEAIQAEKYIKGKKRDWKNKLISKSNPNWNCLNKEILGEWPPNKTLSS